MKNKFPNAGKVERIFGILEEIRRPKIQTDDNWHPGKGKEFPESVTRAIVRVASLSIAIRNARHPDKLINSLDRAEAALVAEIDSHAETICGKPDQGGGNGTNYY